MKEQLAEATSVLKYTSTAMVKAEKREAVLREAIVQLKEQNTALQTTNTKLTLRVRELDQKLADTDLAFEGANKIIGKLEQDGKRLDLIVEHLLIIHPPDPSDDEFDCLWVVCAYELPNKVDCLSKDDDLRQAIDKAMAKAGGE